MSVTGQAQDGILNAIDNSPVYKQIILKLESAPGTLLAIDESDHLLMRLSGKIYAVDLILSDLIDQVDLYLSDAHLLKEKAKLDEVLGKRPLENFLKWKDKFESLLIEVPKLKEVKNKLVIQLYSGDGKAINFKLKIFNKKMISRFKRRARLKLYNDLANDPEGQSIFKYITVQAENGLAYDGFQKLFKASRPTVVKFLKITKAYDKSRKNYYDLYVDWIKNAEKTYQQNFSNLDGPGFDFEYKRQSGKPLKIESNSDADKNFKIFTVQVYNTINALPYKIPLLKYVSLELFSKVGIELPLGEASGIKYYKLTPSFVNKYRDYLVPLIKEYTYINKLEVGDLKYLLHLRKWFKHNEKEIFQLAKEKNIVIGIKNRSLFLPRNFEIIQNFSALETLFPDHPWDKNLPVLYDKKGNPVYLKGRMMRILLKTRDFLAKVGSIENVSNLTVGTGVFLLTGNPIIGNLAGIAVKNVVSKVKYDIPFKDLYPQAIVDVGVTTILGAGFTSGRLAEQIILGGMAGAAQSMVTRRSVDKGAIIGAIESILLGLLPGNIAHPTIKGLTTSATFQNALLELLETSAYGSAHGIVVALVENEDVAEGARDGVLYGLGFGTLKIAIMGVRYLPEISDEKMALENKFQAEHGAGTTAIDRQMIEDTQFRRGGLVQSFFARTFTLGNQILSDEESPRSSDLQAHEMSHRSQIRNFGVIGFNSRYVMEFFKNGTHGKELGGNIYEHYRYLGY